MRLVTGGSGFLGRALIDRLHGKGETIVSISRRLPPTVEMQKGILYLRGDVSLPDLGLGDAFSPATCPDIRAVYHLAGVINLAKHDDKKETIWTTNVTGTRHVVDFCKRNHVPHLYFASTAYTLGRNAYEISKEVAEEIVKGSGIPDVTIFKPSIVLGTGDHFKLEHFPMFAAALIRVHRRADLVRRKIEGTLRLPVIEPLFHLKGNPEGKLNMVPVDDVVRMMSSITKAGTFWLTNPNPPTMQEMADWLSEAILVRLVVSPKFATTPLEFGFQRLTAAFQPYLYGDDFPSDLFVEKTITKETISEMVAQVVR